MDDPSRRYAEILAAAQKAFMFQSPTELFARQVIESSSSLLNTHSGIERAFLDMHRRQNLFSPALRIEHFVAQIKATQEMLDRFKIDSQLLHLSNQARKWQTMIDPALLQAQSARAMTSLAMGMANSAMLWETSASRLAARLDVVGLWAAKPALASRLFTPAAAFTDFAEQTFARIQSTSDERSAVALQTSLTIAEEQLASAIDTVSGIIAVPEDDDSVSEPRLLNAPLVQQEEILTESHRDAAVSVDEAALKSRAMQAVGDCHYLLQTIVYCNRQCKVSRKEEIFKPTTTLVEASVDLQWITPQNDASFSEFVDCLYFLFYEGAGKDKLRFLKSNDGPIADEDFDFILCIKHLRNKWTRHDPDHGRDKDIERSWEELGKRLQWLGLNRFPRSADDFQLLHASLLLRAKEFVDKMAAGLS